MSQDAPAVLLVNPNRMRPPVAPLGLELLAADLAARGFHPRLLDLSWEKAPLAAIAAVLGRTRPVAIGVTIRNLDDCYYASQAFMLPALRRLVRLIKEQSDAPVVLGGVGFSIAPEAVLAYVGADYGLRGDGEGAFADLLEALGSGRSPRGLPGLVEPGRAAPPPHAAAGYESCRPGRGFADPGRYFVFGGQGNLETQRGCNRRCVYCADPVAKGRVPRFREPEAVADEIGRLAGLGVNVLHLCDSEFNLSRRHAEAVARAVIKAGLAAKVKWYAYASPKPMDDALARLLARAGCAGIDFGADAGDDATLERLGRDFGVADLERCATAMKRAQLPFMYDLLLAGPGETRASLETTVRRMKKLRPDRVGISFGVRVFPGTALAQAVLGQGPLEENPCLAGATRDNRDLLRPIFFVSDRLGPQPETHLRKIIDDDPSFLFASRDDLKRNYNYNNNAPLCRLIKKGARGAYWDILRKTS